jgi:hypothetical protein
LDHKVQKELQEQLDHKDQQELQDQLDQLDHKEVLVLKAQLVLLVQKVLQALKDHKVLQETLV